MTIAQFEDIEAWQRGRELTRAVYRVSKRRDFAQDFALKDQIRRAAISVTSNIAEGFERGGNREFIQALSIAKGSCGEVRSQLYTAWDEEYLSETEFQTLHELARETSRLISGFARYLQSSSRRGPKYKPTARSAARTKEPTKFKRPAKDQASRPLPPASHAPSSLEGP